MKATLFALAFAALAPTVQAAEFKLYSEPNVEPSSFCDRYTSLALTEGTQPKALLVNRLAGSCEIAVFPNERQFDLTVTTNACGAKIYKGTRLAQGNGPTAIKIVDNRTMTCEIPVVALVYVEETYEQGVSKLYSHDAASASEAFTLVCGMKNHAARPYLTFIVTREAGAEQAGITYVRSAFFGSEEVQFEQAVPGCDASNVQTTDVSGDDVYVECNADGDAGFFSVTRQASGSYVGHMTFPNTGVEGYSDQSLAVTCEAR